MIVRGKRLNKVYELTKMAVGEDLILSKIVQSQRFMFAIHTYTLFVIGGHATICLLI